MTYQELLAQGRAMEQVKIVQGMRSLMRDDRFSCVVGWLDRNREALVQKYSTPAMSENPGKLAHAAGSVHLLHTLAAQLAEMGKVERAAGGPTKEVDE